MVEGWRMWAISFLTIMLLTLLSAAPIDITDDIKKEDVKADYDAIHSHDENVIREGKFFGYNQFDIGNINVPGSIAGDDVSIGHELNIDVQGHTHDHHHHEDDTVIECKGGLREIFKSIDSNKDGLMDAMELLRVCHRNNIQITKPLALRILTLPDKTVGLNIAKFCELLKDYPSTNSADSIYFLLQLFDKGDCSGKPCGASPCKMINGREGICDGNGICIGSLMNPCEQHGCAGKVCGDQCRKGDVMGWCDAGGECKIAQTVCGLDNLLPCSFNGDLLSAPVLVPGQMSPHDTRLSFLWEKKIIPYYYSVQNTKVADKNLIRNVMNTIESKTCFKFQERTKEDYEDKHSLEINIMPELCSSGVAGSVDEVPGQERLLLNLTAEVTNLNGEDCGYKGLILHELMHVLGVGHTQRRSDRDDFITVKWENLKGTDEEVKDQYRKCENCTVHDGIPYDCDSIMHYGTHYDGKVVIEAKNKNTCKLGSKSYVSKEASSTDWKLLNIIGKCTAVGTCDSGTICGRGSLEPITDDIMKARKSACMLGDVEFIKPFNPNNPKNVKNAEAIVSEQKFKELFPNRNAAYTYENFLKAIGKFPSICAKATTCKKILANMFGHFGQETAGLMYLEEIQKGRYCGSQSPWALEAYPCQPGKQYYGRGSKQLSHNYNYGAFSNAMFGTPMLLLNQPELVATTWLNFASGMWFFVTPQSPKPSILDVVEGRWQPNSVDKASGLVNGFGTSIRIINGGQECGSGVNQKAVNRATYYKEYASKLGLDISGEELSCASMGEFSPAGSNGVQKLYWNTPSCNAGTWQSPYNALVEGDHARCLKISLDVAKVVPPECIPQPVPVVIIPENWISSGANKGRCGAGFVAPSGVVAECDPKSIDRCCSKWGWCGHSEENHCNCDGCKIFT